MTTPTGWASPPARQSLIVPSTFLLQVRVDVGYLERTAALLGRLDVTGIHIEDDADLVLVPYLTEYFRLFRRASASHSLPDPAQAWVNFYQNWYIYDATGR